MQVIPALDAGGAERGALDVGAALAHGGAVSLIITRGGRLEDEARAGGAAIVHLPVHSKNPLTIIANGFRLARIVRERNIAVIHARSRAPAWSALIAARLTGRALVTTYHGIYNAKGALKRLYNSVMARGDIVVANSRFTADHIRAVYPGLAPRLQTIARGIDIAAFDEGDVAPERVEALRRQWGIGEDQRVILLPGRLTRWKGQLVLIEAMARLAEDARAADAVAVLAGDAQNREAYADEVARAIFERGLAARVKIAGHCTDMPAAYLAADIVVSASTDPEAFGRVAVEAQAMGRPVIATAHGGANETVIADETGFLIPPGDAEALSGALARALALDTNARAAMGAKGRAHARATYSREAMCAAYLAVYRAAAALRPG